MAGKRLFLFCRTGAGRCVDTLNVHADQTNIAVLQDGSIDTRNTTIAVSGCASRFLDRTGEGTVCDLCFGSSGHIIQTVGSGDSAQILIIGKAFKSDSICRNMLDDSVILTCSAAHGQ